jgi:hypothetical protein
MREREEARMILRALFWIAVIAVFMPREPNLGLGRPDPGAAAMGLASQASQAMACGGCALSLGALDTAKAAAYRSLAQVKGEIEEAQRERATFGR